MVRYLHSVYNNQNWYDIRKEQNEKRQNKMNEKEYWEPHELRKMEKMAKLLRAFSETINETLPLKPVKREYLKQKWESHKHECGKKGTPYVDDCAWEGWDRDDYDCVGYPAKIKLEKIFYYKKHGTSLYICKNQVDKFYQFGFHRYVDFVFFEGAWILYLRW